MFLLMQCFALLQSVANVESFVVINNKCSNRVRSRMSSMPQCQRHQQHQRRSRIAMMMMVRNIDMPEAIVVYNVDHHHEQDELSSTRWENLIKQCKELNTPFIFVVPSGWDDTSACGGDGVVSYCEATTSRVSPMDLLNAIESVEIQPESFGGSSGFGASQIAEPPRSPMPSRTVVFGTCRQHSHAARFAGMRVISLLIDPVANDDDDLADAVIDDFNVLEDMWLEDIATPGSYWLNPPHPRDDYGNKVYDFDDFDQQDEVPDNRDIDTAKTNYVEEEMDDDEFERILADLSSL